MGIPRAGRRRRRGEGRSAGEAGTGRALVQRRLELLRLRLGQLPSIEVEHLLAEQLLERGAGRDRGRVRARPAGGGPSWRWHLEGT